MIRGLLLVMLHESYSSFDTCVIHDTRMESNKDGDGEEGTRTDRGGQVGNKDGWNGNKIGRKEIREKKSMFISHGK